MKNEGETDIAHQERVFPQIYNSSQRQHSLHGYAFESSKQSQKVVAGFIKVVFQFLIWD